MICRISGKIGIVIGYNIIKYVDVGGGGEDGWEDDGDWGQLEVTTSFVNLKN